MSGAYGALERYARVKGQVHAILTSPLNSTEQKVERALAALAAFDEEDSDED